MTVHMHLAIVCLTILSLFATSHLKAAQLPDAPPWSPRVQQVLEITKPLQFDRGDRLPLYLWPAMNPGELNERSAEELVRQLDLRGIGLISSWSPKNRETTLVRSLTIARAQKKLGLRVNINANECLYRYFNGDKRTAHIDDAGKPFWDDSFGKYKMGCPFALDFRKEPMREQVEYFARAYEKAGLEIGFVFGDWEIDGPIEFNRSHQASKRCKHCCEKIPGIDNFLQFQKTLRELRSELQRFSFSEPILSRFPKALVGNYAVYPHGGYRYWYDYFEYYVEGQPCLTDQRAKYRKWYDDFPGTGYTFAMPVVYTWSPIHTWYDYENSDYRWFYNMLLVASNAGKQTPQNTPIISFVHWNTVKGIVEVPQFSREAYQELLWHMLLRGTDTFIMWCRRGQEAEETRLVHAVYAAAQQYGQFLEKGIPISFSVPKKPGPVISGLRLGNRVLVRRTDFSDKAMPVQIEVNNQRLTVKPESGKCQILVLHPPSASKVQVKIFPNKKVGDSP